MGAPGGGLIVLTASMKPSAWEASRCARVSLDPGDADGDLAPLKSPARTVASEETPRADSAVTADYPGEEIPAVTTTVPRVIRSPPPLLIQRLRANRSSASSRPHGH